MKDYTLTSPATQGGYRDSQSPCVCVHEKTCTPKPHPSPVPVLLLQGGLPGPSGLAQEKVSPSAGHDSQKSKLSSSTLFAKEGHPGSGLTDHVCFLSFLSQLTRAPSSPATGLLGVSPGQQPGISANTATPVAQHPGSGLLHHSGSFWPLEAKCRPPDSFVHRPPRTRQQPSILLAPPGAHLSGIDAAPTEALKAPRAAFWPRTAPRSPSPAPVATKELLFKSGTTRTVAPDKWEF